VGWEALRGSAVAAEVFADFGHISRDGDGARFLAETGLSPREDIDTVVLAMSAGAGGSRELGLVLFEGRFDLARISSALTERGAKTKASAGGTYYLLARGGEGEDPGAVALVNRNLIICGHEGSVAAALARRENGGDGGLTSGQGLGRYLSRVDEDASAWALVDLTRMPAAAREGGGGGNGEPSQALFGAMKSVTLVA